MDFARKASRIPSVGATTNATLAKVGSGVLYAVSGYNAAASVRYIKFYNMATAPTVGTDVPVMTLAVPATAPFNITLPNGFLFTVGIAYGIVTGAADNNTTAPSAADIVGLNVVYA